MRVAAGAIAALWLTSFGAFADEFPVKDAENAVSIAKHVCQGKVDPSLTWRADLDSTGKTWSAMTNIKKSGDPLWVVQIPVAGPAPTNCGQSLYTFFKPQP